MSSLLKHQTKNKWNKSKEQSLRNLECPRKSHTRKSYL